MNEVILEPEPAQRALEERSRGLFLESVEGLDMRTRSRLNQARQAAVTAATNARWRPWLTRMPLLTSAGGVAALGRQSAQPPPRRTGGIDFRGSGPRCGDRRGWRRCDGDAARRY